jgi:hypothetical protein
MGLIYTNQKSKLTKKQRAAREALLKEQRAIKKSLSKPTSTLKSSSTYRRETPHYPSLNSGYHDTAKKEIPQYTGTAMLGIGTLHKSNAVPIFSSEDAKEQARMRRG